MKDLGDLVKDINDAACEGQERAANRIAQSLVTYSPAWTGEFSDNWLIKKGYKNKVANVKGSLNPASIPPYTGRKGSPPSAPAIRKAETGYVIGNRMVYAGIATDQIISNKYGPRADRKNITAPPFWYQNYGQTKLQQDLEQGFNAGFGRYF